MSTYIFSGTSIPIVSNAAVTSRRLRIARFIRYKKAKSPETAKSPGSPFIYSGFMPN